MAQEIRVNLDFMVIKGDGEDIVDFLTRPENVKMIGDFINTSVLEEQEGRVKPIGGGAHTCYSYRDAPCQFCKNNLPNNFAYPTTLPPS